MCREICRTATQLIYSRLLVCQSDRGQPALLLTCRRGDALLGRIACLTDKPACAIGMGQRSNPSENIFVAFSAKAIREWKKKAPLVKVRAMAVSNFSLQWDYGFEDEGEILQRSLGYLNNAGCVWSDSFEMSTQDSRVSFVLTLSRPGIRRRRGGFSMSSAGLGCWEKDTLNKLKWMKIRMFYLDLSHSKWENLPVE